VRRRWQLSGTAVASTAALNLAAVLYLRIRGTPWIQDYLHNAKGFVTANPIDDFSTLNPSRFTLLNLQVPLFSFTTNSQSANRLAFAVGGVLVMAWLYWVVKRPEQRPDLLSLGAISIISLLPVYHRLYDAGLLAVPLCWCILNVTGQSRTIAKIVLLLMTPFLAPGTALLQQLAAHDRIPVALTQSWWWDRIVMPHETWCLLLMCLFLMYGMKVDGSPQPEKPASC
jgi:hypothetical protein